MEGNMYDWVDDTPGPLSGECGHKCVYCYMRSLKGKFEQVEQKYSGHPRLDKNGMAKICGKGKTLFICSGTDLFADGVGSDLIRVVLDRCCRFQSNTYLFHTKNPGRYMDFIPEYPANTILAVTVETNRDTRVISCAPHPYTRLANMKKLAEHMRDPVWYPPRKIMIAVEPVIDFDDEFTDWISYVKPDIISVGADSGNNNLLEPAPEKLRRFIDDLRGFCRDVRLKDNLKRLYQG